MFEHRWSVDRDCPRAHGQPAWLILGADDFGRCCEINGSIVRAHRDGLLTSASLMVTGDAFDEAVQLARQTPTLAVGLHLVLVDGRAALAAAEIPHLVNSEGRFASSPVRAGLRYFFSRAARAELAREVKAQFDRFAATGLALSHVDGHLHVHVHPAVFPLVLPLAQQYGACGVRLPRDDLWLALRSQLRGAGTKVAWAAAFGLLERWCRRRLRQYELLAASRTHGLMRSGDMGESYVVDLLRRLRGPSAEIYFHPTSGPRIDARGPNPGDLQTLLSPAVRSVIHERQLRLTNYRGLKAAEGARLCS